VGLHRSFNLRIGNYAFADLKAVQLFLALWRRADQNQHALAVVLHPGLQNDAVGPDVDIMQRRKITLLPALVLALPLRLQARYHRRRQVRPILAEQRRERLLEIAGRDAAQIEDRPSSPTFPHSSPKYSPDLNPIGQFFAKLKHWLRKAAQRTTEAVYNAVGPILNTVSPAECANDFANAGYNQD